VPVKFLGLNVGKDWGSYSRSFLIPSAIINTDGLLLPTPPYPRSESSMIRREDYRLSPLLALRSFLWEPLRNPPVASPHMTILQTTISFASKA
jgi:hypothetical protein